MTGCRVSQTLVVAVRSLMKPIVRLLVRNGFTYKSFTALCKTLYVEVAEEHGIRGRPANIARIAILTDLDRKEIKRIKDLLKDDPAQRTALNQQDKISRILTGWHLDHQFSAEGVPKVLPNDGSVNSFDALIKRFGGDIPITTWRKELLRLGLVSETPLGFKVLQRNYFPGQEKQEGLLRAGSVMHELGDTLFHNLYVANGPGQVATRFERRASNNSIDAKHVEAFYEYLDKEGQAFLEQIDMWLSAHECDVENPNEKARGVRVSVGLFSFDNPHIQQDKN